ncbi:putative DNA methylation modulator- variant [Rosellinia necatrix]|uniref:Putative DNA methylation modulator-variant n=1 Tax=Rosellinia necatrix TaxID=77044 RepID=A0A1W2TDA7_ROSNE|nr:putative DNA methylation modulator- variant [Rosellinia necatrix]
MEALGLGTSQSNAACSSIEDLQGQLHQLLAAKTTDTRAEHMSPSFELLSHAVFHLPPDPENASADGTGPDPAQPQQSTGARTVLASETVQNQPADDPVLQKAVAKHICNAIGVVDRSAWTVRQVTRGAQGWQFTYICRDSLQAWNRTNAKNPERPVIGSYSHGVSLDLINLSRPAFDCRGTLTISFSKSSRGIIVKYEHTPLHTTVNQLVERLVPAPIPVPNGNNANQRTPKAKRPRRPDGEGSSRKKKTPNPRPAAADGQEAGLEGSHKKRTPRAKRPQPVGGEDGEGSRRKRRKTGTVPAANVGEPAGGHDAPQAQALPNSVADRTDFTGFLNVPPAEAERRRQTAIELLSGKGIDPATLSAEQFNIFANQAPNLQSASLDMLAKYGAERLRIVHPDEKEPAGSSTSTPTTGQTENNSPAVAPSQSVGATDTPSKKPRSKKKRKSDRPPTEVSIGNGAVVALEQDGELGTTESALKPRASRVRKTRGTCDTCKQRKVKCTKEHPSCSVCINTGIDCVYLPPRPRRKSEKSAEIVEEEEFDPPEEDQSDSAQHEAGQVIIIPPHPPPDIENEEFIPDPNILSGPVEHQTAATQPVNTSNYYQHAQSGMGFSQIPTTQTSAETPSVTGFPYSQVQTNEEATQPAPSLVYPPSSVHPQHQHNLPVSQPVSAPAPPQRSQSASSSHRKSLPTSQPKQTPIPPPTIPTHTSNWDSSQSTHHSIGTSPTMAHQQPTKRPRSRKPRGEIEQQGQDNLTQATSSQPTQYVSPMTKSPYQSAAHVNLRQGRRSQTNTPVAANPRPPPQAPATIHPPTTNAPSYNPPTASSSISHYDPYPRYNNSTNGSESYTDTGTDHSSSRVAYESNSYQVNTATTTPSPYSSVPSYDYGRASGAANPLSQALSGTTAYSGATGTTTNQWPTSQTREVQNNNNSSTYSLPASSTSTSHGYATRASDSRTSSQNVSYSQQQSQGYVSYPPQESNLNQQGHQQGQQNWYRYQASNGWH